MTTHAGVLRSGEQLREAEATLAAWGAVVRPETVADDGDPREHEDRNLLLAARLLVEAARNRKASLGAHFRAEPAHGATVSSGTTVQAVLAAPARATQAGTHSRRPAAVSRPKQRIPS